jgi:hypothetical protein
MGARSVVAPGRNEAVLSDLKRRFGDRLVPARGSGTDRRGSRLLTALGQSESGSYGDHDSETLSMAESC